MGYSACNGFCLSNLSCVKSLKFSSTHEFPLGQNSILLNPTPLGNDSSRFQTLSVVNGAANDVQEEGQRFRWVKIGSGITQEQKRAITQLPPKITNRCKALLKQIICYSPDRGSVSLMLAAWLKSMKPRRADWLSVLKELDKLNSPLYFQVAGYALTEESFEANVRDYTKLIHGYAKENRLEEAEQTFFAMKNRGFFCDQVTLTALVHMYSKAGNFKQAEETFEEMKLLGVQLDRRSYGAMIMAYIRAGMLIEGENLLREMETQEIYAGREVYKALLRAYSVKGDSNGAQRIFDSIQLAGIIPDVKVCGLLINAYVVAGETHKAYIAFDNLRRAGLEPSEKCVALVLVAFERENKLKKALDFLIELEKDGFTVGKEASEVLAKWLGKLGVVEEVELVLRDHVSREAELAL